MTRRYLLPILQATVSATMVVAFSLPISTQATDETQVVTLDPSDLQVAAGDTVNLKASMPVAEQGTTLQTLEQEIDPSELKLTGIDDISYPNGWTLSVSFDGVDFTETLPTTATGTATSWDKVVSVKASGPVVSVGTDEGYQVTQASASGPAIDPTPAAIDASGTGDGQFAFFDEKRTRVFNIYHHASPGQNLDCHWIATGDTCDGFPFRMETKTANLTVAQVINNKIWLPTGDQTTGLYCVDISGLSLTENSGTAVDCGSYPLTVDGQQIKLVRSAISSGEASKEEKELWVLSLKDAYCFDTATKEWSCGEVQSQISGAYAYNAITQWGSRIYISYGGYGGSDAEVHCTDVESNQRCDGFSQNKTVPGTVSGDHVVPTDLTFLLPDSDGEVVAVCLLANPLTACWDENGNDYIPPQSLTNQVSSANNVHAAMRMYSGPIINVGTRLYWGNSFYSTDYKVSCWDSAMNDGAGGNCALSASGSSGLGISNYSVTPDPLIEDCLWITGHYAPVLKTVNLRTGENGCSGLSPGRIARFTGSGSVPRMGCATPDAGTIRRWGTLALTNPPAGAWSATLSVVDTDGALINGWQGVDLVGGSIDLTSLAVSATGLNPQFNVTFTGLDPSVTSVSANLTAVGDAPQLCLETTAVYRCPSGFGRIVGLEDATATVSASGSSVKDSVRTDLAGSSQELVISPSASTCGSEIRGRAGDDSLGSGGASVAGVVVTLLDENGDPVLDGSGSPVTVTTAGDGTYSFGAIYPGSYKASFAEPVGVDLQSGTVVSGAAGTTTGTVTTTGASVESELFTTAVGTDAVVNALFALPASATSDSSIGDWDTNQTISPLANDVATTGESFDSATLKLCSAGESPNSCTATSLTVSGEGTYTVNGDGTVIFDPLPTFSGVVSEPVRYQIDDSSGATVSSTITPSVTPAAAPNAEPDQTFGLVGESQSINPLTNDSSATTGNELIAGSVVLCSSADTAPNCTQTSLVVAGQGSYTVDGSTGEITFTPEAGFTGIATAVPYSVQTPSGQQASSTYTPTVLAAPQAVDDTATTIRNTPITHDVIANDGPGLDVSTLRLCGAGQSPDSCTETSITIAGEGSYAIAQGQIVFTPVASFTGSATAITYQVADQLSQTTSATITIVVTDAISPVLPPTPSTPDRAPTDPSDCSVQRGRCQNEATDDSSLGGKGQVQWIGVLGNDVVGIDGALFVADSVRLCDPAVVDGPCDLLMVRVAGEGTYEVRAGGVVLFTPDPEFVGDASPVPYEVFDEAGNSVRARLLVVVGPVDLPFAQPDRPSGIGPSVSVDPVANDVSMGGGLVPGTVRLCGAGESVPLCSALSVETSEGVYVVDPETGVVTFTAASGFSGVVSQPVTYQVSTDVLVTARNTASSIIVPTVAVALPTTGSSTTSPVAVAVLVVALGALIALVGNRRGSGLSLPIH